MKKIIELIRVSTENQANDDRASIPAQRATNKKTAAAFGLTIVKTISMSDVGGSNVLDAPEMKELLGLIENPEIHGVVAREFSRLMRPENLGDFILLQAFADSKTLLYLPDGPIDFATKTGRLLGTIRAAIAGAEKSEFLERSFSSREEMRKQGKCPSAPSTWPYGVAYEDGRGWYFLPEISNVVRAFKLFRSGVSNFGELERETGLTRFNLRNVLSNPIYTGWRVYDKKRDQSKGGQYTSIDGRQPGRRKMCRTPEEVIRVKVIADPIISESDFAHVQAMLASKRDRHLRAHYTNESRFVYHGFLVCAKCGGLEYGKSTRHEKTIWDYYACKNRQVSPAASCRCSAPYMRRERIESHLDVLFSSRLTDAGFIRELAAELDQRLKGNRSSRVQVERLRAQVSKLAEKRKRILDGFFEGVISSADRDVRLIVVDRDQAIATAALESEVPTHDPVSAEQLVDYFRPLFTWEFLKAEAKRRILFSIVPEIRVANYVVSGLGVLVPSGAGIVNGLKKPSAGVTLGREALQLAGGQRRVCENVSHRTTGHVIAEPAPRLFIPLNH